MKFDLKKTLIIVGVALALVGTIVGVIVAIPSGNDNTTTTTTTTTTTKKPGESTTTKPKEDEPEPHEHVEEAIPGKAATCTETGLTDGTKCSVCGEVLTAQTEIPMLPHTYDDKYDDTCNVCGFVRDTECAHTNTEKVLGKAATCTETGLTDGTKCSACGEVIAKQTTIPTIPHTYDDKYDDTCNICGFVRDTECAHTNTEKVLGKAATCTETGLTDGTKCSACGEVLTAQTEIPKTAHTEEEVPGKAATCTETGLTDGVKCSVCGEVLTAQTEIPKTAHTESDWIVDVDATEEKAGSKHTECTICHEKLSTATIPKLEPKTSEGLTFKLNSDGKGYSVDGIGTCLDSEIIIPAKYNNLPVTGINDEAFSGYAFITSVTIPNNITSIGRYAFYECTSLKNVYYQGSLEDWCKIEFKGWSSNPCYNGADLYINGELLTNAVIPDSVTSIGSYAFHGCTSLTSVTIGDSVTSIGDNAFDNCSALKSIVIPDSVTSIGGWAFSGCTSLTSITIPDSVTSIGKSAFSWCKSLTSVTIPDSVTSIGDNAFDNCSALKSIVIPDSVTSIGWYAFADCTSLKSVTIPDSVTSIGNYAFYKCTSLTSVTIPDGVTSIGSSAFKGCTSLETVYWDATACTEAGSYNDPIFKNCTSLKTVVIGDNVTTIPTYAFSGCTSLTSVTIPDSVTSIGGFAFYKCTSLTSVTIPDSVTSIGDNAFYYCTKLTEIHYNGTKAQWNSISKGYNWNSYTGKYTIYCTDGNISK